MTQGFDQRQQLINLKGVYRSTADFRRVPMRKYLFCAAFCLSALLLLYVFATPPSLTPTWTVQMPTAQGLKPGAVVEETGRPIGKVIAVHPSTTNGGGSTDVVVTLDPTAYQRLKENSTFLLTPTTGTTAPATATAIRSTIWPSIASILALSLKTAAEAWKSRKRALCSCRVI